MAKDTLLSLSQNPDERARFHSRRMWLQDREHEQAVWLDEGRAEGREEGRAEGREEGRAEGREEGRAEYKPLLARKDAEIANKDAEIAALRAQLGKEQ